jgi:hypothetical protein
MDAHDEFFSIWCEPEAWCERCEEYPAIHMIAQHDETSLETFVSYVQAWDPQTQEHLVLCRRCSKEHIQALGRPEPEYIQTSPAATDVMQERGWADHIGRGWQCLWRWGTTLLTLCLHLWRRQKIERSAPPTKPYSHSGT